MIATIALWTMAGVIALLLVNIARSDRRIDHLEGRVALLLSAFTIETTVNEDGDIIETITAMTAPLPGIDRAVLTASIYGEVSK